MKKFLETLDGCLNNAERHSKYTTNDCHIYLTDGGKHKIYMPFSDSYRSFGEVEEICVATPHLPVNGTKFTRISLGGECSRKNSRLASTIPPPYPQ